MIKWLQDWYRSQCDGDWEHENGIIMETIDNPGWMVKIDLVNTELEGLEIAYTLEERADKTWIGYSVTDNVFKGVGSSNELLAILEVFKAIVLRSKI